MNYGVIDNCDCFTIDHSNYEATEAVKTTSNSTKNAVRTLNDPLENYRRIKDKNANISIDREMLTRLKDGSKESFELLFRKYNPKIYNFAYSILFDKSLAEDITQSCFLKIWELRSSIDPDKSFQAYLYTITRNLVYKETERKLKVRQVAITEEMNIPSTNAEITEHIDAEFFKAHIYKMIEQLPPARKQIFILSRKHGLSYKDIAKRLSISEKTVETQITRALSHLRKNMKEYLTAAALYFLINNL